MGGWRWGGFASVLRGEKNKHKSTTTTHKTLHTRRCKKNAEFTFSTSSPEVQQQPYYDDNATLNKLMANLALVLPAMFFFRFFFTHEARGSRKTGLRGISHVKASFLPFCSLNASAAHLAAHPARRPGRGKCLGPPSEREEEAPRRAPAVEEDGGIQQKKAAKNTFLRQTGAGSACAADAGCLLQTFSFFLPLKTTSIIHENSVSSASPRGEPVADRWRVFCVSN